MAKPQERYVAKNDVVVDAETAERLGVEGGMEFDEPGEEHPAP